MKKLLAILLSVTLTLGITACGSDKTSDKSDKSDKKETTTAVESEFEEEKTQTEDSSEEEDVSGIPTDGGFRDLAGCKMYDLFLSSSAYQLGPSTFNYHIDSSTGKEYYYLSDSLNIYKSESEPTAYNVFDIMQSEENSYDLGYLIGDGVKIFGDTLEKTNDCIQELIEKDGHQVLKETGTFKAQNYSFEDIEIPYVFCYTVSDGVSTATKEENPFENVPLCWGCYTIDPDEQTLKEMDELVQYALDNVEWDWDD